LQSKEIKRGQKKPREIQRSVKRPKKIQGNQNENNQKKWKELKINKANEKKSAEIRKMKNEK
jgi:hypothetical protein